MAMATLLRLLLDDDIQSKQLQPRSLTCLYRPSLVARNDSCRHRIWNLDRLSCAQFKGRNQVFRWIPSICPSRRRCQRLFAIHPCQSCRRNHLLRHADLLRWTHHDRVHAWNIRQWIPEHPESSTGQRWDHFS